MKTPSKPSESRPSDVKKAKYRVTNWPDQQNETKGLAAWKKESGYHQRSLAENAMYRLKQLFGDIWPLGFSKPRSLKYMRASRP